MRERLVNTPEGAEEVLRILESSREVVVDVETSGLSWKRNHIVGYVITPFGEPSFYVPVRHLGGGNLPGCSVPASPEGWKGDLHWFEIRLAKVCKAVSRKWYGHNLIFDLRFLYRADIELYGDYEDSMINAPLIDENMYSFSLDNVAKREEVQAKKGDELYRYIAELCGCAPDRKSMEHYWRTDASQPVVWQYAAGDGVTTEEVILKQRPQIAQDGLERVHGVECRLIKTLFRMTRGGVRINEEKLHAVDKWFETRAAEMGKMFPPGFNSKSSTQMMAFLGDQIDEDWPRGDITPTEIKRAAKEGRPPVGALKFDAETLKRVPNGRAIIELRQISNAKSLYTQPMINTHLWNGRVHCEFYQMATDDYGTVSGRLSCADPNLQAVSKRNKVIGRAYRSIFEPEEGHVWDDNDYKQQEYVVFTDYTGDPVLMAGYSADPPVDIHQSVADMLGVERDPTAKRMNLGMLYGMGVDKLAASLGVTVAQAREWMNRYHQKFPYARQFIKGAEQRAKARGYVFTYLGRRRRFPNPQFAHKAGNAVIQGSSADITKLKMVEVDEYFASEGDEARLMLQIHDSLSWSRPDTERGRMMSAEAIRIMRNFDEGQPIKMRVPMGVDASTGRNWAEATFGEEK